MSTLSRMFGSRRGLKLQSGGVYLRPPRLADHKAWAELRRTSRPFLEPWEPTWPKDDLGRGAFRRRLGAYARELESGEAWPLFVFRQADDALIGAVRLFHVRLGVAQTATIGYWVGRQYARQGYMTQALAVAIRFAFEGLGLHRLEAACMPENTASAALLVKSGFSEEGYAPAYLKINGEWRDHRLFGLISRL